MLVGRDSEMAELTAAMVRAENGSGSAFFLSGEPGIGKTRLADAVTAEAAGRGFRIAWGRAWEAAGSPAYFLWDQALAALGQAAFRVPGPQGGDAQEASFELSRKVATLLQEVAADTPVVLVLDDLHAADLSSIHLLHFVAREIRSSRVLLLGTFRDVEAHLRADAAETFARAVREGRCLTLRRLNRAEASRLMSASAHPGLRDVEDAIFDATKGNPLFIEEVMRLITAQPELARNGALPISFSIREVIRQRLALLSSPSQLLLEVGAVLGAEFSVQAAAQVLRVSTESLEASLDEALSAAVLIRVSDDKLAFSHSLVREAIYRDLPNTRRMELHGLAAETLERFSSGASAAELAHHSLEAGVARLERALPFVVRAADEAIAVSACEHALELLEHAERAIGPTKRGSASHLHLVLAEARARGRLGDRVRAQELCRKAADLARKLSDPELFALAALGYGEDITPGVVDPTLVGLLEEGLEPLPEGALRARVLARLAAALQPALDVAVPVGIAREAIASARRTGESRVLLDVIHSAVAAMMDIADPLERIALNHEQLALSEELGDPHKRLRAHLRLAFDHLELGDVERVDDEIDAYERLELELATPRQGWQGRGLRAMRAVMSGRFTDADQRIEEAQELAEPGRDASFALSRVLFRVARLAAQTRHEELPAALSEAAAALRRIPDGANYGSLLCAVGYVRAGHLEQARAYLEAAPRAWLEALSDQMSLTWLAEAAQQIGDRELMEQTLSKLLPLAGRYQSGGLMLLCSEGPIATFIAKLHLALGQLDEAERAFEDARRRLAATGALPYLALVEYDIAKVLIRRNASGDRERARALLASALNAAERLEMPGLIAQIHGEPGGASIAAAPRFAMRKEGDLWSIEHSGGLFHLKHTRGLQMLATLVEREGEEIHCTELMGAADAIDAGDAGEVLDQRAMDAYRERIELLRENIREAEAFGDAARVACAREEMDALAQELSRAVGIGGRKRRSGSAAERARVAVRQRLRDAMRKIAEQAPALGPLLESAVKTGTFCSFGIPER